MAMDPNRSPPAGAPNDDASAHAEAGVPVLRTLLVCDLTDYTALVETLGDQRATALLRKHDRLARALLERHEGREIDKTDGFLLLFERPIRAVAFALDYQSSLMQMSQAEGIALQARVGIHMGDVVVWKNHSDLVDRGAKTLELEGLAKPVTARLAALARPGQILVSDVAAGIARRAQDELGRSRSQLSWRDHGRYKLKGVPGPLHVFEVGESDLAPLKAPPSQPSGRRVRAWWQRPAVWALLSVLLVLGAGAGIWWLASENRPPPFSARDWVVVGDLRNRTGEAQYNNAIDSAFRIGLQQSRYVNVIPDPMVRQMLAQMRLPADTRIDTKVGSEIALRLHARVVVVPSIRGWNKGYRVSASLIDPQRVRAVDAISVDADTADGVIGAVDKLVRKLRSSLGESLEQIQVTSVPLAQATTSNMEALRAYSLSREARARGDFQLSINLLHHALQLDPDFASAYSILSADYLSLDRIDEARSSIDEALKRGDRLTYLEQARLQALKTASRGSPVEATAAWKVLADLYPDYPTGPHNAGTYLAGYLNNCELALPYLRHASELPQSLHSASLFMYAVCELTLGQEQDAIRDFQRADADGFRGPFLGLADAYIAAHRYADAAAFLDSVGQSPVAAVNVSLRRAMIRIDQGNLRGAETELADQLAQLDPAHYRTQGWRLRLELVALRWALGDTAQARKDVADGLKTLLAIPPGDRLTLSIDYAALVASYSHWAARLGEARWARSGLDALHHTGPFDGYPLRAQYVAIVQAELALAGGDPGKAVRIAESADRNPLWELLDVIARAKAASGAADALPAFERVLHARDQAIGQLYENNLGICTRLMQWNLDRLGAAQAVRSSDPARAAALAKAFLQQWPQLPSGSSWARQAQTMLRPQKSANGSPGR